MRQLPHMPVGSYWQFALSKAIWRVTVAPVDDGTGPGPKVGMVRVFPSLGDATNWYRTDVYPISNAKQVSWEG